MVKGEIAPKILYEDDRVMAFHDINPQAPVHFLVIPKIHIATLNDVTSDNSDVFGHIFSVIAKLAREQNIAEDGYRVSVNCNRNALQTVFHIHLHVMGGRPFRWPPG